ncbi:GCN5-related N-acetyltransferase OS=Tsukamurella paurometabola (strain ATCC 8368 / DSM / CCUG 35730 / CIP 100753 / JCM 10117 / KCTC 9821 / NBRC 16120 /NCIMB 702349 / NCTC 13040) OX=521096 GN=Tpau_2359 PE=4 SV=1 [Tsukamurella paurometabola]|uniref:GCN5-related N-acetyltransferase n=1 Tax=Tsukamurella paurometabola (strain ATCC 8368 / DSM 20162 / CCUG 35730 / CIP 100753 / JCM 10117 / KCTC 9821 / NBRC 16120 / NCIMB 702349 / NCTC 13040) TaxID=521096 RepID=D5UQX6_TSUPD|nr:GNAT family N-acetyltransferase [Tsukamurella paurometabola]ADG78965.1 GCN5-related N-acetyltransferase [Tsukamurella paurometabola DSM 20162]SUP33638.1 Acetyltransferase (GNAT) family [Tsukamurella paurometabola]
MTTPVARLARPEELDHLATLCAAAFSDDALTAWTHPDAESRPALVMAMFTTALSAAIEGGCAIVAAEANDVAVGASIWVDAPMPGMGVAHDTRLPERLRSIQASTALVRPSVPHVYLPSMAVDRHRRGHGIGAIMLAEGNRRAAERNLPVYLEASSVDNRRFYARHGFIDLGAPIVAGDGAPPLWPMWRESQ